MFKGTRKVRRPGVFPTQSCLYLTSKKLSDVWEHVFPVSLVSCQYPGTLSHVSFSLASLGLPAGLSPGPVGGQDVWNILGMGLKLGVAATAASWCWEGEEGRCPALGHSSDWLVSSNQAGMDSQTRARDSQRQKGRPGRSGLCGFPGKTLTPGRLLCTLDEKLMADFQSSQE